MSSLVSDSTDATEAVKAAQAFDAATTVEAAKAVEADGRERPAQPSPASPRTRFLEVSRRYLLETELPAPRDPAWLAVSEGVRPWLSSRAARRSPAWPVASAPWGRR